MACLVTVSVLACREELERSYHCHPLGEQSGQVSKSSSQEVVSTAEALLLPSTLSTCYPAVLSFLDSKVNGSQQRQIQKWRQGCQALLLLLVSSWAQVRESMVFIKISLNTCYRTVQVHKVHLLYSLKRTSCFTNASKVKMGPSGSSNTPTQRGSFEFGK
jgi:hypothetical protein